MTTVAVARQREFPALGRETIRRVTWRLMPIVVLGYFCAYLDRTNVGMAAPTMTVDLGFSNAVFGFGAGIFYLGYFLAEIPSNLLLNKIGARIWIARILITWGIISGLTAFVWNDWSFHIIRFLLGVAEAGFFPGMLLYLTWWYPERYSSRMIAILYTAAAGSKIIGPPISGFILWMDGLLGMHGWQWLYLLEGLPAVLTCFVTWWLLTDRPAEADWLRPDQKAWLIGQLDDERREREAQRKYSLRESFTDRKVWLLSLAYHTHSAAGALLMFFMPLIVQRGLGVSTNWIGTVSAIPYVFALVGMLVYSWNSDRTGERVWHTIVGWVLGAAAMAATVLIAPDQPMLMMLALIVATTTNQACAAVFWAIPSALMTGAAAAVSLAMINSIGQLGGWFGPWIYGWIRDVSGSDRVALLCTAPGLIISCFALLGAVNDRWFTRTPAGSSHEQEAMPHAR